MTITEFDFPCGCKTDGFDPREWHLCRKHETAEEAIHEWAAAGALLHRAILDLPPVAELRRRANSGIGYREMYEGMPEGAIPRV